MFDCIAKPIQAQASASDEDQELPYQQSKICLQDQIVHVEVTLTVALVAVARKIIVFDLKDYQGIVVIGLALLIVSLAASYWLLGRRTSGTKA